ncbi:MAG: hypothetical protein GX434_04615 [Peptococcaceae bacterium]|nr:hypothetical protein [Peptococcaceae bacterium]
MNTRKPQIIFSKSSPYIVQDVDILEDCEGEILPTKPIMALCRCGKSKTKPYCDGKHIESGFLNQSKEDFPGEIKEYYGREITIYFDLSVCSHSAVCLNQLPSVFNLNRRPWINANGAKTQQIMKTIDDCPSGALKYVLHGKQHETLQRETKIVIAENGPFNVEGGIELCGDTHPPADQERYCLCRCGCTKNTPFCDETHNMLINEEKF